MKKAFILMSLLTLILLGCEQKIDIPEVNEAERFAGITGRLSIITDKETGCKYLREQYGYGVSLTELLKSDGTPDCDR